MSTSNKTQLKADEGKFIEGLQKYASSLTNLIVQGKAVTVTQAVATLQARIDAITAAQTAKVSLTEAVTQQNQELASTNAFVDSLVTVIRGMYAGSPSTLADFGEAPKATVTLTAAQKLAANQKRAATRLARHTMGSKQKAAITGATPAAPPATTVTTPIVPMAVSTAAAVGGGTGTPHA